MIDLSNRITKPHKVYAEYLEHDAIDQFVSAMNCDFAVQGALMPDCHTGYSLPIGSVVATDGVILPSWVGYDIGCGMCAVPLDVDGNLVKVNASEIMEAIYDKVPVGANMHKGVSKRKSNLLDPDDLTERGLAQFEKRNGFKQLGTLGGGNHFIEIGEDENNQVWIVIHSGSRGIGHGIAGEYMRLASPTGKASEGHFGFDVNSDLGQDYINDLNWALAFALENRKHMIDAICEVIAVEIFGDKTAVTYDPKELINRNHNHAEFNTDLGLWIHRKGATHAEAGMMGVIPGNMRDGSFIVKGKGNVDALNSSSHGAGRVLSRRKAKEQLNVDDFESTMKGIAARVGRSTLDESPMAYKSIFEVMTLQKDLVETIAHIKPILNVKG